MNTTVSPSKTAELIEMLFEPGNHGVWIAPGEVQLFLGGRDIYLLILQYTEDLE